MKKLITIQFWLLLLGTVFAWTNFGLELYSWTQQQACLMGCTQGRLVNPFLTPCFYGAIMFLACFILSSMLYRRSRISA